MPAQEQYPINAGLVFYARLCLPHLCVEVLRLMPPAQFGPLPPRAILGEAADLHHDRHTGGGEGEHGEGPSGTTQKEAHPVNGQGAGCQ